MNKLKSSSSSTVRSQSKFHSRQSKRQNKAPQRHLSTKIKSSTNTRVIRQTPTLKKCPQPQQIETVQPTVSSLIFSSNPIFSNYSRSFHSTETLFARRKAVQAQDIDEDTLAPAKPKATKRAINTSPSPTTPPSSMTLSLTITDPEIIAFLHEQDKASKEQLQENATNALRIGVLALKSAQSKVDVHTIHTEIDRMLASLQNNLSQHNLVVQNKLVEYFDPNSGRFEERIKRLLHEDDGELSVMMKQQLIQTSNVLAESLSPLVGPDSKLFRLLDPQNKTGLVSLVQWAVGEANKSILAEFSLDNKAGSLSRLILELTKISVEANSTSAEKTEKYLKELSLDNPASALNRLISTIELGQKEQLKQMSLDNQHSVISRLKQDLVEILNKQQVQLNSMQELCVKEFSTLNTSKTMYDQLSKRTTIHGVDFESRLFSFVQSHMSGSNHIVTPTGHTTGAIRNCKVGDILITMGPEHVSAGAKIVIEAKADSSYNIQKALEELTIAKKNRGADVGVFVFAKQSVNERETTPSANQPLEHLKRYGNDVVVLWDPDDQYTNVYIDAALSISTALLIRKQQSAKQTNNALHDLDTNIAVMNNIVIDLEKEIMLYDDIRKFAETIQSSTDKMLSRLKNSGGRVISSIEKLNQHIRNTRQLSAVLHQQQAQAQQSVGEQGEQEH